MGDVKLHGSWASAFNSRVIWALKFKGIPFEYIEEDLSNKSPQLVQYNPIHKKIPILVHDGKPICESMTIVEYIDDFWPENPLLPSDPHERALARFWVKFADQKGDSIWSIFLTNGEEREKAIKDNMEIFKIVEDQCLGEKKFFGGDNINIVDIAFGGFAHWLGVIEEIVGLNLLEENFPALHAWTKNFKEVPVIKENLPDRDKMLVFFKGRREAILGSSA
ncbi:putative Glutathione s-transferase [Quillaja saponaria]|uniref:glutathione transferase n=1 Tax=Quillaja saponaria TaxID=32244 RepID=A0AAD7LE63_QUISA|nr:putative Glutathione s-transferase [Quillaja saponaria]